MPKVERNWIVVPQGRDIATVVDCGATLFPRLELAQAEAARRKLTEPGRSFNVEEVYTPTGLKKVT